MITFDSIGATISQRTKLSEISNQDKVNLFRYLMDDLGITGRLITETDKDGLDGIGTKIIDEQLQKCWNNKL
jgi:hypothetical protein